MSSALCGLPPDYSGKEESNAANRSSNSSRLTIARGPQQSPRSTSVSPLGGFDRGLAFFFRRRDFLSPLRLRRIGLRRAHRLVQTLRCNRQRPPELTRTLTR